MKKIVLVLISALVLFSGCSLQPAEKASSTLSSDISSNISADISADRSSSQSSDASSAVQSASQTGTSKTAKSGSSARSSSKQASSAKAAASSRISSSKPSASSKISQTVTLSVDGSKGKGYGVIIPASKFEIKSGETVYSVLARVCGQKKVMLAANKTPSVYISAIGGLSQFDNGAMSGWVYKVNGVLCGKGCDQVTVKSGDKIEWIYTLDLGKSEK